MSESKPQRLQISSFGFLILGSITFNILSVLFINTYFTFSLQTYSNFQIHKKSETHSFKFANYFRFANVNIVTHLVVKPLNRLFFVFFIVCQHHIGFVTRHGLVVLFDTFVELLILPGNQKSPIFMGSSNVVGPTVVPQLNGNFNV